MYVPIVCTVHELLQSLYVYKMMCVLFTFVLYGLLCNIVHLLLVCQDGQDLHTMYIHVHTLYVHVGVRESWLTIKDL